jgi:hypothetical protein
VEIVAVNLYRFFSGKLSIDDAFLPSNSMLTPKRLIHEKRKALNLSQDPDSSEAEENPTSSTLLQRAFSMFSSFFSVNPALFNAKDATEWRSA